VYDSNEYISDKILLAKLKAEQAENGLAILYDLKNNVMCFLGDWRKMNFITDIVLPLKIKRLTFLVVVRLT
jgi:hypothetical protein